MSNPTALLTLGIFALLVTAWALWPRFTRPVPDPEEGSGGTSLSGVGRAPEPPPVVVQWAWREWHNGPLISRPFDTPKEAGRYRAALADPRHMTLIRLEDGERCRASGEEASAAIVEFVDRTREMAT